MSDKPKPFQIKSKDTLKFTITPDGRVNAHSDSELQINLDKIQSVGIENIVDIESYAITRIVQSTSHHIKFFGGGEVAMAYSAQGRILDFKTNGVQITISNGDRLMIRKSPSVDV